MTIPKLGRWERFGAFGALLLAGFTAGFAIHNPRAAGCTPQAQVTYPETTVQLYDCRRQIHKGGCWALYQGAYVHADDIAEQARIRPVCLAG